MHQVSWAAAESKHGGFSCDRDASRDVKTGADGREVLRDTTKVLHYSRGCGVDATDPKTLHHGRPTSTNRLPRPLTTHTTRHDTTTLHWHWLVLVFAVFFQLDRAFLKKSRGEGGASVNVIRAPSCSKCTRLIRWPKCSQPSCSTGARPL